MRVHAACALALVEHRAHDGTREPALALGRSQVLDARVDLRAEVGSERVEALAKQLPLGAYELRDIGETAAARVAAATARPPRALVGRSARTPFDVVVEGEEAGSHEGGFIQWIR
jgi:hypothetical protein